MGLDISVFKPIKNYQENDNDRVYTYNLEENPELKDKFSDFAFDKENSYYDIKTPLTEMGHTTDNLIEGSVSFGEDAEFTFINKLHPLYHASEYLNSVFKTNESYFPTMEDLENSEFYKNFITNFKDLLVNNGWEEEYYFFATGNKKEYYNLVSAMNFCREAIKITLVNPPTIKKIEKVLACEEVGYQRKGANSLFYEQDMWGSPCVTDLKTLIEHHEKYFSGKTPDSKGGWGSGVEFDLEDKEMKIRFQENIIDKFVEGETFVMYH